MVSQILRSVPGTVVNSSCVNRVAYATDAGPALTIW